MSTSRPHPLSERGRLYHFLHDWAEEDMRVRVLARRVLPNEWVNGGVEGVPSVVDIVERLVEIAERKVAPYLHSEDLLPPLPARSPLAPPFP